MLNIMKKITNQRGSAFVTIILIFVVVVGAFTFTYVATTNQNDEITESNLQAIVSKYANTSANEGEITADNHDAFIQEVSALGKSYTYELEVQVFGDNPNHEKGENVNVDGENVHYIIYKYDVEKAIHEDGKFDLKKGDNFKVSVQMEQTGFQIFFTKLTGKDIELIKAEASASVTK